MPVPGYFEHDNAIFRKRSGGRTPCVDDVLTPNGWKPYTGDRLAPIWFGSEIIDGQAVMASEIYEGGVP